MNERPKIQKSREFTKFKIMSETREHTRNQLRRILSMAFSLDAAMDALLAGMAEVDAEGNIGLKDQRDEEAYIAVGGFHEQVQNMTYGLYRIISRNYERDEPERDGER